MDKPFIAKFCGINDTGLPDFTGLVIPISDTHCRLYWSDGESETAAVSISLVLHYFNMTKIATTEQEILAWRLKHGI